MPRIYNATFLPFTYDELATPIREMTAAHQAEQEKFDALMTDADKMKAFLNENWQSYKDYSEYINQLNSSAEDLAKNGLTRLNRGNLLQLKRDYNGKIQAINAGILSRLNAIENFNKSAKGQSSRYIGPRPEDYSVDEYMYGNNPFKLGVDGSEIYSYADEQAKALTSRLYQEYTDGNRWRIEEVGANPDVTNAVLNAVANGMTMAEYGQIDRYTADIMTNNQQQFKYMDAMARGLGEIVDTARDTFGYGEFGSLNDNGDENWVRTPNQTRFDSEILGGMNRGIQYKRDSEADPYAKMNYQHRLNEIEADNDLDRWIVKQGLEAGTLAYDPVSKTIIPVDNSTTQSMDLSVPQDFGVITRPYTMTNPNTMNIFKELGYKDIKIGLDENGNPIVTGFNDINNERGGIGFTFNKEKQFFNNRVDLTTFVKVNENQLNLAKEEIKNLMSQIEDIISDNIFELGSAKDVLNSKSKQEYLSKFGNNNNYNWSELYDKYYDLKYDLLSITEENGLLDLLNKIKKDNKQYILSDKQYNKLKEAMYIDGDYMTMDQMQESYLYNPSTRNNWDDEEYSLISQAGVKNSSNVFRDELLNSLKSAFIGDGTVTEYEDIGNDTYQVKKKKHSSSTSDYHKLDKTSETGIILHINDITVTKGSLMNDTPLIKIYYTGEDGEAVKIIPVTRLNNNNVIKKIKTLTDDVHGLYQNININNVNDRVALSNIIKYNIANLQ